MRRVMGGTREIMDPRDTTGTNLITGSRVKKLSKEIQEPKEPPLPREIQKERDQKWGTGRQVGIVPTAERIPTPYGSARKHPGLVIVLNVGTKGIAGVTWYARNIQKTRKFDRLRSARHHQSLLQLMGWRLVHLWTLVVG